MSDPVSVSLCIDEGTCQREVHHLLVWADHPRHVAGLEAACGMTQAEAVDDWIESSCWSDVPALAAFVGHKGSAGERRAALRMALADEVEGLDWLSGPRGQLLDARSPPEPPPDFHSDPCWSAACFRDGPWRMEPGNNAVYHESGLIVIFRWENGQPEGVCVAGPPEAALNEETLLRQATEFYLRHCQQDTRAPSS